MGCEREFSGNLGAVACGANEWVLTSGDELIGQFAHLGVALAPRSLGLK
jgi:hypothetical protein